MADASAVSLTELQQKIIHSAAIMASPTGDVADDLGCSPSYVREITNRFERRVQNAAALSDVNHLPVFHDPFCVLFTEDALDRYSLQEGDLLELTCSYDGESETTYGKVRQVEPDSFAQAEERARVCGAYFGAERLNEANDDRFTDIPTLSDGRANPQTDSEFRRLLQQLGNALSQSLDAHEPEVLIGAGILEVVHGRRDPTEIISTPYYRFENGYFTRYLCDDFPDVETIRLVTKDIQEPEAVYFTCYGERQTKSRRDELRAALLEQEYFKASWNYAHPGTGLMVGPTSTDVTTDVIRVTPESLRLVPGVTQSVHFFDAEGDRVTDLDVGIVYEAIQDADPEFGTLEATRGGVDTDFPVRRDGDSLSFLFDQVTLVLTPRGDEIEWQRPAEIPVLDTFVSAVNDMIRRQLGASSCEPADAEEPRYTPVEDDGWVLDTNALYHDHVRDEPCTILHTVFAHPFFEGSTVYVPWPVLFEFNKHADPGKEMNRKTGQGFENLATLKTLEQLGFLTVSLQDLPDEVDSGLNIGDVADFYVLSHASTVDARLVTGDHALEEIAQLADLPVVNIADLATYSAPIEGATPEEEILPQIGKALETEAEIIDAIESEIDTDSALPVVEGSHSSPFDAESKLQGWRSAGRLTAYYHSTAGEIGYAQRSDIVLVPTVEVVSRMVSYTNEETRLLVGRFVDRLVNERGESPVDTNQFPYVHLLVPIEYVVRRAKTGEEPSDFNRGLLKMRKMENVEYEATPALAAQSELVDRIRGDAGGDEAAGEFLSVEELLGVSLAASRDNAKLVTGSDQSSLWKFGHLLGVEALRLEPTDE